MLIVGAKGFAKELLQVVYNRYSTESIAFYDDISTDLPDKLFGEYKILKSKIEVIDHFKEFNTDFVLGVGDPEARKILSEKIKKIGGTLKTVISDERHIGSFNTIIEEGCSIMQGTVITNDVRIEEGCLININCTIGHDSIIGAYSELCPGVHISGNCVIGKMSFVGTGAVILPGISVGNNSTIAAGSVVTKDVPQGTIVKGIPAK